jgi:aspartate/methionine/tyrosine aminotransferase
MSLKKSAYLNWAKYLAPAKYNLARSGILACGLDDLDLKIEDVIISGANDNGYLPLQELIADTYGVNATNVVPVQGTSSGNYLVIAALLNPGDEVLIEQPTYEPLIAAAKAAGGVVKRFHRRFEDSYEVDIEYFKKQLTSGTKLIILSNPHNPSGVMASQDILKELVKAADSIGAYVLIDEVYRDVWFEDAPPSHIHLGGNVIATSSLGKAFGLGGVRGGWILCEELVAEKMRDMSSVVSGSSSMPSDSIALKAFWLRSKLVERSRSILQPNYAAVKNFLKRNEVLLECVLPKHSMIVFPKLKKLKDAEVLYKELRKHDTAIVPGVHFETPNHFRIGFGQGGDELNAGLNEISKALAAI